MTSEIDPREVENHASNLRRQEMVWRARHDSILHADRGAVDIGLVALRTAVLVNAGAIVALLAFISQLWDDTSEDTKNTIGAVLDGMGPFIVGLVSAGVCSVVAYFYQSLVTARRQRHLREISKGADKLAPAQWLPIIVGLFGTLMIGLVVLSYGAFVVGTMWVVDVLAPDRSVPAAAASTTTASASSALSFAGLFYDIAGVVLLGLALLAPTNRTLRDMSGTPILNSSIESAGENRPLFQSLRTQKFDAWFGIGALIIGFGAQAAAAWGHSIPWRWSYLAISLGLPALLLVWWHWRKNFAARADHIYDELGRSNGE